LDRLRSSLPANFPEYRLARGAICAVHTHFDQLVPFQAAIDFREYLRGQAGSADEHDRIESVRTGLQFAAAGGG
jgi:hypothetical protein